MHRSLGLFALAVLLSACAERRDERSPAEIACARHAEQVMAERNRSRNLWSDTAAAGQHSIIEDTASIPRFNSQMDIVERDRLTRECLRRASEQPEGAGRPAAREPSPQPAPQGWSRPPALLRW